MQLTALIVVSASCGGQRSRATDDNGAANAATNNAPPPNATANNSATNNSADNGVVNNVATNGADTGSSDVSLGEPSAYIDVAAVQAHGMATSQVCADCHSNDASTTAMRDTSGRPIAPFDLWQSTMKANAARDPFFRAVMSAEIHRHPEAQAAIEATCLTCHAPMAKEATRRTGTDVTLAAVTADTAIGQLGSDGVSCVACHAMTDEGFGLPSSFSGQWTLTATNELYGPHAAPFTNPMEMRAGFVPTEGSHILESEQCATCHSLFTEAILPDGTLAESNFPEQSPYLEWKNSAFSSGPDAQSCQDCHSPKTDVDGNSISTRIARRPSGGDFPPTGARSPYGRHTFVGGNTLIPAILRDNRDVLKPTATDAAFDATIAATVAQLQQDTVKLSISNTVLSNGAARFDVRVENLTGHKFPTAYPSRRAWLHVRVVDAGGATLWESGAATDEGDIAGQDTSVQPHHTAVTSSAQVQIYQSVLGDSEGEDTVALLHATAYVKDNRLLPIGYSSAHPDHQTTAPVGTEGDGDFLAGGDTTAFDLTFDGMPARVEVEVLYQALGNRWVRELLAVPTADVRAFGEMWERADRRPVVAATAAR